jgi:hypothetical protein
MSKGEISWIGYAILALLLGLIIVYFITTYVIGPGTGFNWNPF